MASALKGAALVLVSLLAASTALFMAANWQGAMRSPGDTSVYLYRYTLVLANTLAPGLVLGALALLLRRRLRLVLRQGSFLPSVIPLTGVFAGLIAYSSVAPAGYDFSRRAAMLAWVFCLAAYFLAVLTERLPSGTRARIVYSRPAQLFVDGAGVAASGLLAYLVRFDGWPSPRYQEQMLLAIPYLVLFYLGVNYLWGVYRFIWRFTGLKEALVIAQSVASGALVLLVGRILAYPYPDYRVPFGVLVIQPILLYFFFLGVRVLRRVQYRRQSQQPKVQRKSRPKRILLAGAGQAGQMLLRELEHRPNFRIVGFLDDDPRKRKSVIHGVRVVGSTDDIQEAVRRHRVDEVVVCMPSADRSLLKKVVSAAEKADVPTSSVPSLSEILVGKVSISRLRPVRMEDLLGRASIEYAKDDVDLTEHYWGSRILVTGAAGSIGSELVRQLKEFQPSNLILLDNDENGLYEVGLEVGDNFQNFEEVIADVRNLDRIRRVFAKHRPQVVFHAAAFKHVPLMEHHPCEAVLNNVAGSRNVVDASVEYGVRSFVLVSTDKAVNPTNIMGATKRVAETIVQRKAERGVSTRLCCVRFGNVLGSRASVVPLFQKQIRKGRDITVTHPDIQRYFMTIPEAVQLVIQAGVLGRNGEIFVLDMGDPVKIVDLARDLIELSGLVLDRDISIEFTGLRPGEKMCEELLIGTEHGVRVTRYPKIFVAEAVKRKWEELEPTLDLLTQAAQEEDLATLYSILEGLDIGYARRPVNGRSDSPGTQMPKEFPPAAAKLRD